MASAAGCKYQPSPDMKQKMLMFIFCWTACMQVQAQTRKVLDSLTTAYHGSTSDTSRIVTLANIAFQYRSSQPDTCIALAQRALQMSEEISFEKGKIVSYNIIGVGKEIKSLHTEALAFYQKALTIAERTGQKSYMAIIFNNIGNVHEKRGNYPKALESYQKSVRIKEELNERLGITTSLTNIGNIYYAQEEYEKAVEFYQKSLQTQTLLQDKKGMSASLNNIGNIYNIQDNYPIALEYYQKSLAIKEEIGDRQGISSTLNNLGSIHNKLKDSQKALDYFQKSLAIKENLKDEVGSTFSLAGMARAYLLRQDYDNSIMHGLRALDIAQKRRLHTRIKDACEILYLSYKAKQDYIKSLQYHELFKSTNDSIFNTEKSKAIATLEARAEVERKEKEIEILHQHQVLLEKDNQLQKIETERQKNARLALEKQAEADRLLALAKQEQDRRKQDSLQHLAQQRQDEADKLKIKEKQLEAENRASALEIRQAHEAQQFQQIITGIVLLSLAGALAFSALIWRNRQKLQKANDQISYKNREISAQKEALSDTLQLVETQKHEIQQKNQNITASITYALRIQKAILMDESELNRHLSCFVLFRPRDIVSGDFYWYAEKNNQKIFAVADCTGHGVSGALMTMIGNTLLNQIVLDKAICHPDQILNELQILLEKTLSASQQDVQDGMDIAVLNIGPTGEDGLPIEIEYAGAMNPLYIVQHHTLYEIKADKKPVGGKADEHFVYQRHCLSTMTRLDGLMIYLCSDGYQDQFGGAHDRKFMVKNLRRLLTEIADCSLNEQKRVLSATFEEWQGAKEQTDDVLVAGIRW